MAKRTPPKPEAEAEMVTQEPLSADAQVGPVAQSEPEREPSDVAAVETSFYAPENAAPDLHQHEEPVSEPTVTAPMARPTESKRQGGGFLSTALGGVVAAAAGYALATFAPFPGITQPDAPTYDAEAAVTALSVRLAVLEDAPIPESPYADRIAALESRLTDLAPTDLSPLIVELAALEARLLSVENQPPAASGGDTTPAAVLASIDSLRSELDQLKAANADATAGVEALAAEAQARLLDAETQAARMKAEAEETARQARNSSAVGRVRAALESGSPFASALNDLMGIDVPETLVSVAETGVPTRAALETAFVPAARSALEVSLRTDMGESWSDRMASFLQSTTGARSLEPRDGTDPDAVLSRAEAALRAGDLSRSLTELQGLPPEGLAAMSDWVAMAQQRLDAIAAAAALSAAVEG